MNFDTLYNKLISDNEHEKPVLDFSDQWVEYKKYDNFQDALKNFDKEPTIENLAKIALEEPFSPLSFTHPDLWEKVQEISKKALKIVKNKSSLELERLQENPNTPEELFIAYIFHTSHRFHKGGKENLIRILNKIIKEDRWEMLMQNRENLYINK